MGALMRREQVNDHEVHLSTGKLGPAGVEHVPVWSEWRMEWFNLAMRQCQHPDCDLDDYRKMERP